MSVEKLAFAVLLVAAKKSVQAFRIRPEGSEYVVEHRIGDETFEDMRAPAEVLGAVIRRLSVMANLPVYRKGESAGGLIELQAGEDRLLFFAIRVAGHGPTLVLDGRVLTASEYEAGR